MYRIELAPGEETVFRTIEELAVGVRNGLVTARARIYHAASQKWLPIEFHPHYKKAVEPSSHRQDLQPAKIPESLESLNFAVPRGAASPAAPTPPETPAAPAVTETVPAAVQLPTPPAPAAAIPSAPSVTNASATIEAPVMPPPSPAAESVPRARHRMSTIALARFEPLPAPVVVETPEPEEQHAMHLPLAISAPSAVEDEPVTEQPSSLADPVPPAVASPVLQFPAIVYPDITPAEPPTVEPVTPAARSRRPLHILGAIAVLALGGYGMMSLSPARGDAAPAPSTLDRPAQAEPAPPPAPLSVEHPVAAPAPSHSISMSQPASSGFAPALEPRAIVSTNAASVPVPPAAAKAPVDSSLSPAPVDIQLDVPALPGSDSLVATPRQQGDSAMKRILRAVNGGKDAPARP